MLKMEIIEILIFRCIILLFQIKKYCKFKKDLVFDKKRDLGI
jgi:hypothetical protein